MSDRDPIALLMKEHDDLLSRLKALKKASLEIQKKGYSEKSFKQIVKAAKYIDIEVRVHNKHEEDALFVLIEKYVDGPTLVMREDHRKMLKLYKKLSYSIKAIEENPADKTARQELCESADDIVQLMVNHIHNENQILFPMVQRFCSKEELRKVAKQILEDHE
ncbi:MAG: hemerythrin domain-containing protein [Bacteroidetes bacterium]|nr:hemerythrin domain-containing protein [Bacteroidota bacterium]